MRVVQLAFVLTLAVNLVVVAVREEDQLQPSGPILWQSLDPRTAKWVSYDDQTSKFLEAQLKTRVPSVEIALAGRSFKIDFGQNADFGRRMVQDNHMGGFRDVRRVVEQKAQAAVPPAVVRPQKAQAAVAPVMRPEVQRPEVHNAQAAVSPAAMQPQIFQDGRWVSYVPNPKSIIVVGPGIFTLLTGMNKPAHVASAYDELHRAGYQVEIVSDGLQKGSPGSYDVYPDGFDTGNPDLNFHGGRNLASLADDLMLPKIKELVNRGHGPAVLVVASRGGQVTTPQLWKTGWRGPTVMVNAGCTMTNTVVPAAVRLAFMTGGQDYFKTNPDYIQSHLQREDQNAPVLMYHTPSMGHVGDIQGSGQFGQVLQDGVLLRLIELVRDGFSSASPVVTHGSSIESF